MHVCQVSLRLGPDLPRIAITNTALAVPSLFTALITHPTFTVKGVRSLRRINFGGTVISPETLAAAADPNRIGVKEVSAGFGMSEVLPVFGTDPEQPLKDSRRYRRLR